MKEKQEVMEWPYIRFSLPTRCVKYALFYEGRETERKSVKNECHQMSYRTVTEQLQKDGSI